MKRFLCLLMVLAMAVSLLVACGEGSSDAADTGSATTAAAGTDTAGSTDSAVASDTSGSSDSGETPKGDGKNLVIACDQAHGSRVVIYDMANYDGVDLDHHEMWSYTPESPARGNMSGVKYRENTVFGDVIIMVASGGYAGIVKYPSKEVVWEITNCGSNPHSIEILPSGNVVTASSTGSTLRLYYTSALLNGDTAKANTFKQYSFTDAHGVLWDPEYEMLWAAGGSQMYGYLVGTEAGGTNEILTLMKGMGGTLPKGGAHDLSADMSNVDGLFITVGETIIYFDKQANKFMTAFGGSRFLNHDDVKGFGNNLNGCYFQCYPNAGKGTPWEKDSYASWCTDKIYFFTPTGKGGYKTTECVSGTCAYYKVFCFAGQYQ